MKTKRMLFWGLALASVVCGLIVWLSQKHQTGLPVVRTQRPTPTPVAGRTPSAGDPATTRITFCKTPEELPPWAVKYGQEFWGRQGAGTSASPIPTPSRGRLALDLGAVIDRVSHAFQMNAPEGTGRVQAGTYVAELKAGALEFSPARPVRQTGTQTATAAAAPAGMDPQEKRLAALVTRTPETPEEEDWLMARISEIAAENGKVGANESTGGQRRAGDSAPYRVMGAVPEPDLQTKAAFQTLGVRQGDRLLYQAADSSLRWCVLGNTAQAMLNAKDGLLEHFEAEAQGVTVTWVLSRPLKSAEPVTITAQMTGLAYAGQSSNGHHFADADGIARIRVGNVTIADSAGRRWEVPTGVEGGAMVVAVPDAILAQAAYPLAIDPLISPEFGMDTPVVVPAPAAQQNPAVAANGGNFFVVWEDQRSGGINGTRVTGAGAISDPNGIAVSPAGASSAAIAPNGNGYLVVWVDDRNASTSGLDIYGARVSSAGQVLDTGGFAISQAAGDQFSPAATAHGADSFVVWQDGRSVDTGPDIYAARVTSGGVVSDPNGIPISGAVGAQAGPAVAFNGTDFLVVWSDQRGSGDFNIYGARVTTAGTVLDTSGLPVCTVAGGEFYPKVAASGAEFLVVWEDGRNAAAGSVDIYGARVSGAGAVLDRGGFLVGTGTADRHTPAVAAGPTDYLVVWQDSRNLADTGQDIYGARVTTGGAVTDPDGFVISTAPNDQSSPALAFDGTQYLVAWTDARNLASSDLDVYGALVSPGAVVSPSGGLLISRGASGEQRPVTASNGTNYLVVWEDYRNGSTSGADLYGVRVSTAGAVLDYNAIPISTATADQVSPAVASDGSDYLVVWEDYRNNATTGVDIYGARVSAAGTVLDPAGFPISSANSDQMSPAISRGTGGYLVTWQDGRNSANSGIDIYGARVSSAGVLQDVSGIPICTANSAQYSPAVAFNGADYLVVWSDERNLGLTGVDIYGTRVSLAGAVLDSPNLAVCEAAGNAVFPAVASAGGGFLVVWEDGRNSATSGDNIYGARVTGGGVVSDPGGLAIAVAPNFQAMPAVAASGTNYLVVWQDARTLGLNGFNIYGARVETDGTVLDTAGLPINTGPFGQRNPKLASGSPNGFLVVCQSVENGNTRAVGNFVYLEDFPIITHISFTGGHATLTWLSIPNRTYRVQFKDNLSALVWNNLVPDITASGTISTAIDNTAGAASTRYYRVVLLP